MSMAESLLLEVIGLQKRFGSRVAVTDFSLKAIPGELIALAGPNGSGKSTALRLMAGLLRANAGAGFILGCHLSRLTRAARNAMGFLPQRAALYASLSVYENLRFRAAVAGMSAPASIARQNLTELGLSERSDEPLAQFSGGWQRHIEIAATLIHAPRLLLLDEPTTGLDTEARNGIWQRIEACRATGAGVIFSSHEPAELARATRCVSMAEIAHAH